MARNTGAACRVCRREGVKLFLKGTRCYSEKCALTRRGYPPGQHGQQRAKLSAYAIQLREKQKLKSMYGILERQFRGYFVKAERLPGITGSNLLQLLERRLDNLVYRLGFATSRDEARQLVLHGHILVDNRKIDIPSYLVSTGQVISVREKSREIPSVKRATAMAGSQEPLPWLERNLDKMEGKLLNIPSRDEIPVAIKEQLIVELYSK
ncbi:MAG: 30S ribosomal protein S4 [bacterium]|nr:30S ribosomal protein S4 [bacterium]